MAVPNTFSSGVNTSFSTELNENFTYVNDEVDKKEVDWVEISNYTLPTELTGASAYSVDTGDTWTLDADYDYIFVFSNLVSSYNMEKMGIGGITSTIASIISGNDVVLSNNVFNNSEFEAKTISDDDAATVVIQPYYTIGTGVLYSNHPSYVDGRVSFVMTASGTISSFTFSLYKRLKVRSR